MMQNVQQAFNNTNNLSHLERLRNLINVPPANRPSDFVNPLEKIEQLLTCSICLDRFKNPKLLPCQHTYCMEPCLEGLVDLVKCLVKCPECRAEHPLPLDGVRAFQTNYSLMGFLEIHIQATEENAADLEAYIRRYNLERCKVCDEKSEVELCQHCDKKICLECKATHMDMLKRDLGRLMNQVKRIASRIGDASDSLGKSTEFFTLNCENVKEEVKDYVNRFVKELKKRESSLINEIEAFQRIETRVAKDTRENLDLEVTNINEACSRVEASMKGERQMSEEDLVRFKQIFAQGVEYLRSFNIDIDEVGNKKIRFLVGSDPHLLPHAITQFGELQICTPQYSQKLINAEQFYVPRFSQMGLESDQYSSKKRHWGSLDVAGLAAKERKDEGPSLWKGIHQQSGNADDGEGQSSRVLRRRLLEERAWHRLRNELTTEQRNERQSSSRLNDSPMVPANITGDHVGMQQNGRHVPLMTSPWARIQQISDSILVPNSEQSGSTPAAPRSDFPNLGHRDYNNETFDLPTTRQIAAKDEPKTTAVNRDSRTSGNTKEEDLNRRRQSEPVLQIPPQALKNLSAQSAASAPPKKPVVADQKASIQIRLRSRNSEPQRPVSKKSTSSEEEEEEEEDEENGQQKPVGPEKAVPLPVKIQRFDSKNNADSSSTINKSASKSDNAANKNICAAKVDSVPSNSSSTAVDSPNWKKYLFSEELSTERPSNVANIHASSSASSANNSVPTQVATVTQDVIRARKSFDETSIFKRGGSNSILDNDHLKSSSRESVDSDLSWNERRRRFVRSKTNPELSSDSHDSPTPTETNPFPKVHQHRYRHRLPDFGNDSVEKRRSFHEIQENSIPPPSATSIAAPFAHLRGGREADRRNRYKRKAEKSHSGCSYVMHSADDENGGILNRDAINRNETCLFNVTGPGSKYYRALTSSKIDYTLKGKMFTKFGCKGSIEGQFNWPRGVSVFPATGEIVICDSSNHRLQIFDRRGNVLKSIGSYGSAKGEFDCLAGVCVNKYHQFVVSDRYNHRIQIFDSNGRHLREFGSHGQSNGRFHSPWGIVVDTQGFIYVCDKDNHRIQIFQADGSFVGKFGVLGNREGQFQNPHFVAVNRQNHLIVTDSNNHRVQVFDHDGHFLFTFGSEGFHEGQFKYPRGVAIDDQGIIVVADSGNNRIQMFWPDGRFYTTFGSWGSLEGQLKGVEGVAVAEDGHIIVTDRDNHRVQIF